MVVSQMAITASWGDAKVGTVANALIAIALIPALADLRPSSNHATYRHRVRGALGRAFPDARVTTEDDLARLPQLVRTYLHQDAGGKERLLPWSTPVSGFRTFAPGVRLPSHGEGWWDAPGGAFPYLRIELDEIDYDPAEPPVGGV
jgi:hypothetical protein